MEKSTTKTEQTREEIVVILSEDVLVEILARIPVKSLMRFKCVCKSWYRFISDPAFIRKHFLHYTSNLDNSSNLLVIGERRRLQGNAFSLISSYDDTFSNQFEIPVKVDSKLLKDFQETGHENFTYMCHGFGIVCFRNDRNDNLALWNPTTREFRILPELCEPICASPDTRDYYPPYICCGLGFDFLHNDYKLVHFGYRYIDNANDIEDEPVTLYTSSNNSWKTLDVNFNGKPWPPNVQTAVYINGFSWWFAKEDENPSFYDPDGGGFDFIASFDVNDEIFRYYPLPECCRGFYESYYSLFQLHNHVALCLCPQDDIELIQDKSIDIWLMEEFGAEVTWTKKFTMGPFQVDSAKFFSVAPFVKVIGFWPSSKILVIQLEPDQLVLYDFTSSKTVHFELQVPIGSHSWNVYLFSDSLVHVGGIIEFWTV